MKITLEIVFL